MDTEHTTDLVARARRILVMQGAEHAVRFLETVAAHPRNTPTAQQPTATPDGR